MSKFKIVFFDIDGTILRFGHTDMTEKIKEALRSLQKNGIKICIATGRTLVSLPDFPDINFDLTMAFNGSICIIDDKVIFSQPIPADDVRKVVKNAAEIGRPVAVSTKGAVIANGSDDELEEYFSVARLPVTVSENFDAIYNEEVYQIMLGCHKENWDKVLKGTKDAKIAAWWPFAIDVIPKEGGKGNGVKNVLEYFGFKADEALAFGDGAKDIDMLMAAGCGVAMGNSADEVKAAADEVCGEVDDDGVYYYLKEKGII